MKSKRVEQEAPKGNKTGGMGVNAKKQKRS
jgi:hypothetical protein